MYGLELVIKQTIWLVLSLSGFLVINRCSRRLLYHSTWFLYGGGVLLLIFTILFGVAIRGDRSWIDLGVVHLQASEFMKAFLVLAVSRVSETYASGERSLNWTLLYVITLFLIPFVLILLQPDIGTSLIYTGFFVGWFFVLGLWKEGFVLAGGCATGIAGIFFSLFQPAGAQMYLTMVSKVTEVVDVTSLLSFVVLVGLIAGLTPYLRGRRVSWVSGVLIVIVAFILGTFITPQFESYQKQRLRVYLNPYSSPMESGYNIIQAQIAIGSGGWFGHGYLQGSQSQLGFIPELWTDFIYSVAVEEFGLIFGTVILLFYLIYIYCFFSTATMAADWEGYFISSGLGIFTMLHIAINLGVCVGIVPVVGLPLPFLSYGGSFLVTNWFMLGVLTIISRRLTGQALLKAPM